MVFLEWLDRPHRTAFTMELTCAAAAVTEESIFALRPSPPEVQRVALYILELLQDAGARLPSMEALVAPSLRSLRNRTTAAKFPLLSVFQPQADEAVMGE